MHGRKLAHQAVHQIFVHLPLACPCMYVSHHVWGYPTLLYVHMHPGACSFLSLLLPNSFSGLCCWHGVKQEEQPSQTNACFCIISCYRERRRRRKLLMCRMMVYLVCLSSVWGVMYESSLCFPERRLRHVPGMAPGSRLDRGANESAARARQRLASPDCVFTHLQHLLSVCVSVYARVETVCPFVCVGNIPCSSSSPLLTSDLQAVWPSCSLHQSRHPRGNKLFNFLLLGPCFILHPWDTCHSVGNKHENGIAMPADLKTKVREGQEGGVGE